MSSSATSEAGAQTLGMTRSLRDVNPPIRDFTTYHMSYRHVPLRDWEKAPSFSRASDISPQNPLARPPVYHTCYETTTAAANTFWHAGSGQSSAAAGAASSAMTAKTGTESFVARARERVRQERMKEREKEEFFAEEARYMFGLRDEPPVPKPGEVHPAVSVGLVSAPPEWPKSNTTLNVTQGGLDQKDQPTDRWTSRESAQLQQTLTRRIAQFEHIKNPGAPVTPEQAREDELAQRRRALMRSIYPPDFSPKNSAIKHNIAFTQPYRPPQPTTYQAAVQSSQVKIDEDKYPLRRHFKFNYVSVRNHF